MSEMNNDMQMDGYLPYCIGLVVADKPFGTDNVLVWPSGKLTMTVGNPLNNTTNNSVTFSDSFGNKQTESATQTEYVEASWLRGDAEHLWTSPMVRAGESVQLYRYKDTGRLFWKTIYREPQLRKLERIVYGASNASGNVQVDLDSMYYIDYDTINKSLTIRTTQSDGEAFGYTIALSPRDNQATMNDSVGNQVTINSSSNNVVVRDATGGRLETRDGRPRVAGPKGVSISVGRGGFSFSGMRQGRMGVAAASSGPVQPPAYTSDYEGRGFYEMDFDPDNYIMNLNDVLGNKIVMESMANNIKLEDASGGMYETRDGHPKVTGPRGLEIEAPETIINSKVTFKQEVTFENPVTFKENVQMELELTVEGYANLNGGHTP